MQAGPHQPSSLLAVSLALAAATLGCQPGLVEETHTLGEIQRRYRTVRVAQRETKQPLAVVVSLHAFSTDPRRLEEGFGLLKLVAEQNLLLVVPEGERDSLQRPFWNATTACCDGERRGVDDVGFLRAVLRDVKHRYTIDPTRVHAIGVSNGGFMAYRWACEPGGDLRGIVVVSGAGLDASDGPCAPTVPVAVLHVHGDGDEIVGFNGGVMNGARHPSAYDSVGAWLTPNGCAKSSVPERSHELGIFRPSTTRETWACPKGRIALWTVPGGGHQLRLGAGFGKVALQFLEGR